MAKIAGEKLCTYSHGQADTLNTGTGSAYCWDTEDGKECYEFEELNIDYGEDYDDWLEEELETADQTTWNCDLEDYYYWEVVDSDHCHADCHFF